MTNGLGFFWPKARRALQLRTDRGARRGHRARADPSARRGDRHAGAYRIQVKRGNRDFYGSDFVWIDEAQITGARRPPDARRARASGMGQFLRLVEGAAAQGDRVVAEGAAAAWPALHRASRKRSRLHEEIRDIEKGEIGAINYAQEKIRLERAAARAPRHRPAAPESRRDRRANGGAASASTRRAVSASSELREVRHERLVLAAAGGRGDRARRSTSSSPLTSRTHVDVRQVEVLPRASSGSSSPTSRASPTRKAACSRRSSAR